MRLTTQLVAAAALLSMLAVSAPAEAGYKKEKKSHPVAKMVTDHGTIYIELFPEEAPKTVRNFIGLVTGRKQFTDVKTGKKTRRRFYDGLTFHRVIKKFMLQGGDPKGTGTGGPGYKFADEIDAEALGLHKQMVMNPKTGQPHPAMLLRNQKDFFDKVMGPLTRKMGITSKKEFDKRLGEVKKRVAAMTLKEAYENLGYTYTKGLKSRRPTKGMLCMANAGPNTNGSQFFINLIDTDWLAGKHTVFGKVVAGMDVVEKIGRVDVDAASRPKTPVRIISIRIVK